MGVSLLVLHRGAAALAAGLVAPDGARLACSELPAVEQLAARLAWQLVAERGPSAVLVLREDHGRRDVGVLPVDGGPLGRAELEEELGWLRVDVGHEPRGSDAVVEAVVRPGGPVVVGLATRPGCPGAVRATQLVLDVLAERLEVTARRTRRASPVVHGLRCRPVRQLR